MYLLLNIFITLKYFLIKFCYTRLLKSILKNPCNFITNQNVLNNKKYSLNIMLLKCLLFNQITILIYINLLADIILTPNKIHLFFFLNIKIKDLSDLLNYYLYSTFIIIRGTDIILCCIQLFPFE